MFSFLNVLFLKTYFFIEEVIQSFKLVQKVFNLFRIFAEMWEARLLKGRFNIEVIYKHKIETTTTLGKLYLLE